MKHKLALLMALAMTVNLLCGCIQKTEASSEAVEAVEAVEGTATEAEPLYRQRYTTDTDKLSEDFDMTKPNAELCASALNIFKANYKTSKSQNTLISPLSLQSALALLIDASEGQTKREILSVYDMPVEDIAPALSNLMLSQEVPETTETTTEADTYNPTSALNDYYDDFFSGTYKITNAVWCNSKNSEEDTFLPEYRKAVEEKYAGEIHSSDLTAGEGIKELNNWVNDNTLGLIKAVFPSPLDSTTMAVLLNAIGFEYAWEEPFEHTEEDQDFTTSSGDKVKVEMMYGSDGADYIETDNVRGVKLYFSPYVEDEPTHKFSMTVVMPKKGVVSNEFTDELTAEELVSWLSPVEGDIDLTFGLPKFSFETDIDLQTTLGCLGVSKMFMPTGELHITKGSLEEPEYISKALQKTKIEVTEYGTRAAAVTAFGVTCEALLEQPEKRREEVIFDKPFIYTIWDEVNKVPIFIGTVDNPTIESA